MGVTCEITIQKQSEDGFKPGALVKGFIKYVIDKDTEYEDIIISLKGNANCRWAEGGGDGRRTYSGNEVLFILQTSVICKEPNNTNLISKGEYTAPFEFRLPNKIPTSFKHNDTSHSAVARIKYYVRIKFIQPGAFNLTKKFKKRITVNNNKIDPSLSDNHTIFGVQKELTHLFKKTDNCVKLKATVSSSYVKPKDKIQIMYEIENNSIVNINRITTNLMEIITMTSTSGKKLKLRKKYPECKSTIATINPGCTNSCGVVVPTLEDMFTIQNAKVIRRDYKIIVAIKLPMPHRNEILKIPLEIGYKFTNEPELEEAAAEPLSDEPPSYWEIMEVDKTPLTDD